MLTNKPLRVTIGTFTLCIFMLCGTAFAASYHFKNGQLLTMTSAGASRQNAELLVTSEKIIAIGPGLTAPADAISIDLRGGYLMPGLTEMHAHVPSPSLGQQYRDDVLFLFLANGITTIRGMLGNPAHLELRTALNAHQLLGPRLITSGPSFNGNSVWSPIQAARMVESQYQAGYDFLKIHPGLTLQEYDAVADAANRLGIPFAGHVPAAVGLLHALESGQATIDHLDGYVQALVPDLENDNSGLFAFSLMPRVDNRGISALIAATKASGAAVVPTETLLENFAAADQIEELSARPQNIYLPRQILQNYRQALSSGANTPAQDDAAQFLALRKQMIRELHDGGVTLLLGSDAPQVFNVPGFSAHRELSTMVEAGLSPIDALLSGTRNPAEYFALQAEFGTLEEGKSADLVWLREDPRQDIENSTSIEGVMVRGVWLDRTMLDTRLSELAARVSEPVAGR